MEPRSDREPVERMREAGAKMLSGIGKTIEEGFKVLGERGNVVMVRINDDSLRAIDALVEVGLFKTRSEAAAFLIHEGIKVRSDVFDRIHHTVDEINQLRQQLRTNLTREGAAEPATRSSAIPVEPSEGP